MITDQQTNTVFVSDVLTEEYQREFQDLMNLIKKAGYKVNILNGTDDFYCRDFMPVQVLENDFVQFVFRPEAYLKDEALMFISNPVGVELANTGTMKKPRYSPLILDGGNMVKAQNKVIVTDRVLKDNRYQFPNDEAIAERLKFDLKSEIIIIPEYPEEETGHADSIIRFIDDNRVFINDADTEPEKEWLKKLLDVLTHHHLTPVNIPCGLDERAETADGLYINYLHVGNLIVVPQFGLKPGDKKALDIMNEIFGKTHQVIPFRANWLAENGGVFNCATWTIKA